jgi:protein TonB
VMVRAGRARPPGTAVGMIGTVVVHAAAAALLFTHVQSSKASPPAYAVELVAAPAPTTKTRLPKEAPPRPPVEKPAPVKSQPKASKAPPAPTPKAEPKDTNKEPPPKTAAPVTPLPGEAPSTGTDVATIKTPGLEFPYPEYLRNIVSQVYRNWDRDAAQQNHFAEISFLILRDGSVRDIRFVTRSGSFSFDLSAQGAIEASANAHAFGPLPDGWDADVLPVTFQFQPIDR